MKLEAFLSLYILWILYIVFDKTCLSFTLNLLRSSLILFDSHIYVYLFVDRYLLVSRVTSSCSRSISWSWLYSVDRDRARNALRASVKRSNRIQTKPRPKRTVRRVTWKQTAQSASLGTSLTSLLRHFCNCSYLIKIKSSWVPSNMWKLDKCIFRQI